MAEISAMKLQFPRTWQVIRVLLLLVGMLVVVNAVEWSYARPFFYDYRLFDYVQTTPALLITGLLAVSLFRSRSPIRYYLIVGLLSMAGIGFVYSLLDVYVEDGSPVVNAFINYPYFWIVLCLSIEAFCFLLALSRRSYLIEVEKNQIQQQLIDQLEKNGRLQHNHTVDLERQLAQRTTEVLTKAHELEGQRVSQLQSDFVRRIAEAEMTGLRSQMNPHFIFNCLNSIKLYATENDSEKAAEYLTKFSRLIRMVLENSRSERVTLRNELDMLQLYADMEIMRFKQKLSFSVAVEPGIDAQFIEIPPLLLQPYVENAIWHGLMHKSEGGSVRVQATQPQENLLQLTITDDGIGRARAVEIRSKSASHRKSFGLKMTSERIALVNQLYQTHTQVMINDLVDTDGQPAGTEVILQIPL
jgi:sensor histidine kinase YesM